MAIEYIKTMDNIILGTVETAPNGDQTAKDFPSHCILGYYRAAQDKTFDFFGRIVARGNALASLIYNKDKGR